MLSKYSKRHHTFLCMTYILLIISCAAKANIPIVINAPFVQGGLIHGHIPEGAKLTFNNQNIHVTQSGHFVLGLSRDQSEKITLKLSHNEKTTIYEYHVLQRKYRTQSIEGVAQKFVTPPKARLERIANDNKQVKAARQIFTAHQFYLADPVMPSKGRITGVYGSQRIFNGTPKRPHYGLDIAAPVGTAVISPFDGVVSLRHDDMYYSGGTLIIDHGMGISSTFIHLDKIHVKKGDMIQQGQLIADVGATGRVTGPHLDWRVNWFNTRLDPALLFKTLPTKIE